MEDLMKYTDKLPILEYERNNLNAKLKLLGIEEEDAEDLVKISSAS